MHPSEDLERAFERLETRRARLETLSAQYGEMQRSPAVRLRSLWHFIRSLIPVPLRRSRVLLAYEGVTPFPPASDRPSAQAGPASAEGSLAAYFDEEYYLVRNPDVVNAGVTPFQHYVHWGAAENRVAHPLFDPAWYVERYREAARFPGGAIRHYATYGWRERLDPHPAFAARSYAAATGCAQDALAHYLANGAYGAPDPHPLFDGARYRALRGDIGARAPLADLLADPHSAIDPHPLFDTAYYRAHSPDAVAGGNHPFVHFLTNGSVEGRAPNPWFDPNWYRTRYPDVESVGLEPLAHFAVHGWREGRNPSPAFMTAWYAATHLPGRADVNPLTFHIESGRRSHLPTTPFAIAAAYRPAAAQPRAATERGAAERPADVVVPVYRGLAQTKRCIESVLRSDLPAATRVIVIDDASPEPAVSAYVDALRDERVTALRNRRNLGFVGTVNRAFRQTPGRDVVLLNSDTVVAGDWLARLQRNAYAVHAATVTPFSNNATICSFPAMGASNACDPSDVPLLDAAAAAANPGRIVDLPTGVGFCMYVRRDALDEIGIFDEDRFGRGYGEEVDFCRRAAKAGWRNVLATDVFVFHEGEVSFGDTASPTKSRADVVVRGLHPEYEELVRAFVSADRAQGARVALAIETMKRRKVPVMLFVTHALGGGIGTHIEQLAAKLRDRATVLQISPGPGRTIRLDAPVWPYMPAIEFLAGVQDEDLRNVLRALRIDRAHVHSVVGFPLDVEMLLRDLELPFDFTIHDYYAVCPQITMSDRGGVYCGEPDEAGCAACIAGRPPSPLLDITAWRDNHAWLVRDAARVIAPSLDARERMRRYHPDSDIVVVPHAL